MTTVEFLLHLRSLNVRVWVADGQLHHRAPDALSAGSWEEELYARQEQILAYLTAADDCERTTQYIQMRDGVRLAADIFRPKRAGKLLTEQLPVLWCQDRYHRSTVRDGVMSTKLDSRPWLRTVMRHGYVIAALDARGTGASTGVRRGEFSPAETRDAYDVTEWFARQGWCNGRVGMYGDSYLAIAQLLAASTAPPHLKAIFPQMPLFDLYSFLYPGGVLRDDFVRQWAERVSALDTEDRVASVAGYDQVAARAARQHLANYDIVSRAEDFPYRDSQARHPDEMPYGRSPSAFVDAVSASRIPVCILSGWYDMWVRDALLWFTNLGSARRLIIGPSAHTGREHIDLADEHLRWFDYWLKGIDTAVMDGPPIRYWRINSRPGTEWNGALEWPPPGTSATSFYFHEGPSGCIESVNDGMLAAELPDPGDGADEYQADYSTSSGRATRWVNGYGGTFCYESLTSNDRRALTYTSGPLDHDLEVTGHPIVHLHVTSTYPDGDFFIYLEDVQDDLSRYVTEGALRASCRGLGPAPYRSPGLPYHVCTTSAHEDLPTLPAELIVDLHPTSWVFKAGHRIRVAVTCADRDNARTPIYQPAPIVTIYRQVGYPSHIELPVMADSSVRTGGDRL